MRVVSGLALADGIIEFLEEHAGEIYPGSFALHGGSLHPQIDTTKLSSTVEQWVYPWTRSKVRETRSSVTNTVVVIITTAVKCQRSDPSDIENEWGEFAAMLEVMEDLILDRVTINTENDLLFTITAVDEESLNKQYLDFDAADRSIFLDHLKITAVQVR